MSLKSVLASRTEATYRSAPNALLRHSPRRSVPSLAVSLALCPARTPCVLPSKHITSLFLPPRRNTVKMHGGVLQACFCFISVYQINRARSKGASPVLPLMRFLPQASSITFLPRPRTSAGMDEGAGGIMSCSIMPFCPPCA